ncbi:MAG: glutathione S-transferase family protein [Acidobacteria bacterium]|nr:glutathione S-transferase family protein [Acidobacteriota bacterium]
MKIYGDYRSGNCYKIKHLLTLMHRDHTWVSINVLKSETRTPEFLAKNPNGRIPILELSDGRILAESNAILFFLAQGTQYIPKDEFQQAKMLQWMFFEQYSHEPHIAVARFILCYLSRPNQREAELPARYKSGYQALDVMESHLAQQDYFVGDQLSLADIALYAYTRVADEAKFDLSGYAAIQAWFDRIEQEPGHILMRDLY